MRLKKSYDAGTMALVDSHEAKAHFLRLLERVRGGEEIVISHAGKPVAKLVPYTASRGRRRPGGWEGRAWIAGDFDELPPELERAFRGEEP
jgi:prevent-host-death family protein